MGVAEALISGARGRAPQRCREPGLLDAPWGPAMSSLMRRCSFPRAVTRARWFKSQRKGTSPLLHDDGDLGGVEGVVVAIGSRSGNHDSLITSRESSARPGQKMVRSACGRGWM